MIRINPEEEYFRLTCLALKITHSENDIDMTVFNISEAKLFRNLKRRNIPFHLWHSWIGD